MEYFFVKIAPHQQNRSGLTSRGWRIHRDGRKLATEFGPVSIIHGRPKRIYWAAVPLTDGLREWVDERAAAAHMARMIREKERDGYFKLPGRQTIRAKPGSDGQPSRRSRWLHVDGRRGKTRAGKSQSD